ncbi:MAG: metallopeptidase TldD-related protein, partial [Candidatus Heimdallarchaeota archaeon]
MKLKIDGSETEITVPSIGLFQVTIAKANGKMEAINHGKGGCSGYEVIQKTDWNEFAVDVSELAIRNVKADAPPAGTYPVVVDPHLVGILTHEAFGHAAEADLVFTGTSTLKDRLGEQLCSEQVTIVDEGIVKGEYNVPFDDEGTPKEKTIIVGNGV